MTESIKIELQGLEALKQNIAAMISRGSNMKPFLTEAAGIIHHEVMQNFEEHGRNPKWQELAKSTKQRYAKKGYLLKPTLDRSSAGLVSSIQEFITGSSAGVSTNKAYAAIHNFGGPINRPARSGKVRLRTDAKGGLMRQDGHSNLAVFAKSKHKRAAERAFTSDAFTIHMPQREFMKIGDDGIAKIEAAASRFLTGA